MKPLLILIGLVVLSGCICLKQTTPVPQVIYYTPTTVAAVTSTSTTDTTSTTTTTSDTTSTMDVTRFTKPYNRTYTNEPGPQSTLTTMTTIPAPYVQLDDVDTVCVNDSDCLLVEDCCGAYGRQYAINRVSRSRYYTRLACFTNSTSCVTNLNLIINRYRYTICDNGVCRKVYDKPME